MGQNNGAEYNLNWVLGEEIKGVEEKVIVPEDRIRDPKKVKMIFFGSQSQFDPISALL